MSIPSVLNKINQRKIEEITERSQITSIEQLHQQCEKATPVRGFHKAIEQKIAEGKPAVISEIKKASPSKGVIRGDFNPAEIAKSYEAAGAACLSVLTDKDFFQGATEYLKQARAACDLPVIRKDFLIDPYQIVEARAMSADAVLLIVASLEQQQMQDLYDLATSLGMDVLIEAHDAKELDAAITTGCKLIGINNRNLHDFSTNLAVTTDLLEKIPNHVRLITESGIHKKEQVQHLQQAGVHGFLVGEAFMRFDNPGDGITALFQI